jgi:hypothetical protein
VTEIYEPTGIVPTNIKVDENNPIVKQLQDILNQVKTGGPVETKNTTDLNMNIKVDGGSTLPNGLSPEQFKTGWEKFINDPANKSDVLKMLASNNSGLLTQ